MALFRCVPPTSLTEPSAQEQDHFAGSGNVFADLGLLSPDELHAKAELAIRITEILRRRRLT